MYGKATFIKVNLLRYDSLSQIYQGTSVQVLIAFNGIVFLLAKALIFLLLAEYYLKHIVKEPTTRLGIHISFRMFQAMNGKIGKLKMAHQF